MPDVQVSCTRFLRVYQRCYSVPASAIAIILVSSEERESKHSRELCTSDDPKTAVKKRSKIECAAACNTQRRCKEHNFDETTKDCSLYDYRFVMSTTNDCSLYTTEQNST